jgi:hypothetical protein
MLERAPSVIDSVVDVGAAFQQKDSDYRNDPNADKGDDRPMPMLHGRASISG